MPFKKGQSGNPKGRPKGSKNLTTEQIRDAFQALIESSLPDIQDWLRQVAEQNPEKALRIIEGYSDFILPKLQRTELSGGGDKPLTKVVFDFGTPNTNGDSTDEETTGDNTGNTKSL
jgi:hypothetical protein